MGTTYSQVFIIYGSIIYTVIYLLLQKKKNI